MRRMSLHKQKISSEVDFHYAFRDIAGPASNIHVEATMKKRMRRVKKLEKDFAVHRYKGRGKTYIKGTGGSSQVFVVAPYSVDCVYRESISANKFSGAIVRLLADESGCGALFAQKAYRSVDRDVVYDELMQELKDKEIKILLELRSHRSEENSVVLCNRAEGETEQERLGQKLIRYTFEYVFREYDISEGIVTEAEHLQSSILSEAARALGLPCIVIDINDKYLDIRKVALFHAVYDALFKIVTMLSGVDWEADRNDVYRVWQADAGSQIPQDKIEILYDDTSKFRKNAILHICSFYGIHETVRVHSASKRAQRELKEYLTETNKEEVSCEYVILTNRLIEILFRREWYEQGEEKPGLRGIPVIVYESKCEEYEIGIPKADQVNGIALSTALYKEKIVEAEKYDYLLFNRYSDSRIYIDMTGADYHDEGRVKARDGTPRAKKVMMPRYYRLMMGYLEKPLRTIRAEEYNEIISGIGFENNVVSADNSSISRKDFEDCYKKMPGQSYYQLIEEEEIGEGQEVSYRESKKKIIDYLDKIGVYSHIDLIRMPKKRVPCRRIGDRLSDLWCKLRIGCLNLTIGKADYILKTQWAGDTDDKHSVARLNNNMMRLVGVSENDKIMIKFGENVITLRVLARDTLSDYEIGIPASGRRALGMNSINDIVVVHRDMTHTFKRHSQEQTIAILGTVLAVVQVLMAFEIFTERWVGMVVAVIVCVIAVILILYFALSEERVKVK